MLPLRTKGPELTREAPLAPAANFGKPWSEGEDRTLIAEFDSGIPMPDMARKHARTHSSIRLRLEKLGKIEPTPAQ